MRFLRFWMVLAIMLAPAAVRADVSIQTSVDRTELVLGESLDLQVSLHGGKGEVDTDGIKDFKVVSRGSSTSIQMTNGQFSQEVAYTFTLIPLREGTLMIPALPVRSDGKTYYTREIAVSVSRTPGRQGEADTREVFVEAAVSENAPYESQQIRYTFRVWQRAQIANAKFQQPDFAGFTVHKLDEQKEYKAVSANREYHVTEVNFLLIPVGPGEKTIEAAVLTCDIVRRSARRKTIFEDPFSGLRAGRLESRVFRTEPVAVTVKPLPPYTGQGRFSGLVGRFDVDAELASMDVRVGDSTTLSVTVQGTGNIMDAGVPEVPAGDAFKVYGDTPEEEIRLTEDGYSGKKVFRSALVPVREGTYAVGPIEWVYFDVSKEDYVLRKIPPFKVQIRPSERPDDPGAVSAGLPDRSPSKKTVEFVGRDILPLKDGMDALSEQRTMSGSAFLALLAVPPLLWLMVRFTVARLKTDADPARLMAERAEKAMREAGAISTADDGFLGCLYRGLVSAVLSRAGTVGESLTYAEVSRILLEQGFKKDAAEAAARLLERIESARFSGAAMDSQAGKALFEETRQTVRRIIR